MTALSPEKVKEIIPMIRWGYDPIKDIWPVPLNTPEKVATYLAYLRTQDFYYLLIDAADRKLVLQVYHMRGAKIEYIGIINAPQALLKRAIYQQGGTLNTLAYYPTTQELDQWVCNYANKANKEV